MPDGEVEGRIFAEVRISGYESARGPRALQEPRGSGLDGLCYQEERLSMLDDGSAEFTRFLQQTPIYVFCALAAQNMKKISSNKRFEASTGLISA